VTVLAAPAAPARAQTDLSRFGLAKAIPADCFIAVAARANPDRQFLDAYWARVIDTFLESGILDDIWDICTETMNDESLEVAEDLRERFGTLCGQVDWCELFTKEMIHVGRFSIPTAGGSPYEGLIMGRMDPKKADANYTALRSILSELVKFANAQAGEPVVQVIESEADGVKLAGLAPMGMPTAVVAVAQWKDTVAVSFGGQALMAECIDLLRGESNIDPLIQSKRFTKAFAELPPAEDSLVFFDPSLLFERVGGMIKMFAGGHQAGQPAQEPQGENGAAAAEETHPVDVVVRLFEDLAIIDVVAEVEWTEGYRVFTESSATLRPGAADRPIVKFLAGGEVRGGFERFIPKEADNFSCSTGVNLVSFCQYIRGLIAGMGPDGEATLAEFDRMQKEDWGIDLEKDVLALFAGPVIAVEMGSDWVLGLKVTNEEKAVKQVNNLLSMLNGVLGEENALMLSPVKVAGDHTFTQVTHPMMMIMGGLSAPVWGCAEDHLFVASSVKAASRVLKTASGNHPNITANQRWKAEGLRPGSGRLDSINFADERTTAQDLQALVGILSMASGFAGMGIQGQPDLPPQVSAIVSGLPTILAKLGPVVGKLDFYQSSAGVTTFDGQQWHTKSVQNYKEPSEVDSNGDNNQDTDSDDDSEDDA
jgi:hypothetical protein